MNQTLSVRRTSSTDVLPQNDVLDSHTESYPILNEKVIRRSHYNKKKESKKRAAQKRALVALVKQDKAQKKGEILDVHGLFEQIGGACDQGKKIAGQIDNARKFSAAIDQLKVALRYSGSSDEDMVENAISRLEDLTALVVALLNTKNYAGFIATIHMYVRTHYVKSTSKVIIGMITKLFSDNKCQVDSTEKLHLHSDDVDIDGVVSPEDQVNAFKSCLQNWRTARHGIFARNLCHLVNILTTFGWLNFDKNPVKIGDLELFRARVWDVQKNSFDFIDVVVDTFSFFLERGYLAFVKGDFSLLLHDDAETARFEQEYSLLVSCDTLMETGRLEDLKTEKINGEADFEKRLELLIVKCYSMLQAEKNPHAKTVLTNRLVVLKKLRSKLIMLQKESPVRTKPYGVCIFGGSAVGKSMINAIVTKVLLEANDFGSSKQHVVTLNDSDSYQSEFRTFHTAVTMDDFGNTKADKYDTSPTAKIIDFLNNVPKAALSPIAELKGNVMVRPKVVTVTTNVKTLLANLFSNEPVSILRRFEAHLDVQLRPEWVDPETGGLNSKMIKGQMIPDAWMISLQRVRIQRTKKPDEADDFVFEDILTRASIREVLDWLVANSQTFFVEQDNFVESTERFFDMKLCSHWADPSACPKCTAEKEKDLDVHSNECPFYEDAEEFEPIDSIEHIPMRNAVFEWYRNTGLDTAVHKAKTDCKNLYEAFEKHKKECLAALFVGSASIALIYGAVQMFKSSKKAVEALSDHGREDGVPEVLATDHASNWKKVEITPLPMNDTSRTRSQDQFEILLKRHLAYCTVYDYGIGRSRSCNIFPIRGNTWLLPAHMIDVDHEVKVHVRQGRGDSVNRTFTELVDESKIQRFGDDFMLVRLVKGGPIPDTSDMIVQSPHKFQVEHMKFMVQDEEGIVNIYTTKAIESRKFPTVKGNLRGFSYNLPVDTEAGMCIAPVYTYRGPHIIVGFHLAGKTGSPYGVAGHINMCEIEDALMKLNKKNSLQCHSDGTMVVDKYERNFTPKKEVPKDHAAYQLADDEQGQAPTALIYGTHDLGRSFFRSDVRKSPISDAVKKHLGINRDHGPPKRDDIGKHWVRDLNLMAHPKGNFRPSIWLEARMDLLSKCDSFLEQNPEIVRVTHPLAHDYVMSGADGIAAFSRLPLNTSMGWPLNKKKSLFIGPVDREVPGISEPIDFENPMFFEELERIEMCLSEGKRIHTVFRGNLKDEPTKWTKDKIRVFAGCEVAFTCVVRKYYLPIVRLIQNNWLHFECAVGINAHGPQWAELTEYVIKHGKDRIIAGDYAAFDKSASPEAMMSAFDILIQIARFCGYTEEELMIMKGVATEISYPIYELDGVIMQLFGSNPSGHPLTVIVNNLMNSLYMRYVYYTLHEGEDEVLCFDEVVNLMCYGDDNIMSVATTEEKFTMCNIVPILNEVGIKYTKADKTAVQEGDDFETIDDVEFLKRAFVWNPAFGNWTAALAISSIGKSLHNQMVSKTTPRDVIAAEAIRSANAEFAFHGPELFREMQPKLYDVASECGLTQLVGELPTLQMLVDRYDQSRVPLKMVEEPILDVQALEVVFESNENVREKALQTTVIEIMKIKPLLRETPFGSGVLGEPDLVFHFDVGRQFILLCVETKSVITGNATKKRAVARKQANKYAHAISILTPSPTIGVVYTEFGFEYVCTHNIDKNFELVRRSIFERIEVDITENTCGSV